MAALRYDKERDEMINDPPKSNIQVIDVDCQGLVMLSLVGKRFAKEFPLTYTKYVNSCRNLKLIPGMVITTEERGHRIALMVTIRNRVGIRDSHDDVISVTKSCVDKIIAKYPNATFSSGILNRHTGTWITTARYIFDAKVSWVVHKN
jgi:hypothetical protein